VIEALAFLTILPARARARSPGRGALLAFPLVGLLVGGAWAGTAWGARSVWGALAAAGLVMLVDLLITGGLHLDALADLVDGLASRRPAAEAVAIMRDSRIGAVGAAGLGVALLLRFAFVASLVTAGKWGAVVLVPVAGRFAMVWVMTRSRSVSDVSLASGPCAAATPGVGIGAGVGALVLGGLIGWWPGIAAMALAGVSAEVCAAFFRRRFGALVGDTIGAAGSLAELLTLAFLSAVVV